MERAFPASAGLLNRVPMVDISGAGSVVTDASVAMDSKKRSNLPPGYETVPGLLRKIDESNLTVEKANSTTDGDGDGSMKDMTPSERAQVKVAQMKDEVEETARFDTEKGDEKADYASSNLGVARQAVDNVERNLVAGEIDVKKVGEKVDALKKLEDDGRREGDGYGTVGNAEHSRTTGKEKLQRLLGKGDFDADKVEGGDVIDDSVYKKQERRTDLSKTSPQSNLTLSGGESFWKNSREEARSDDWLQEDNSGGVGIARNGGQSQRNSDTNAEVAALKAELESQMRWEAVRLQEAVRSQMVEDKKIAANAAAEREKKYAEELERVREEAMATAGTALRSKTAELQKKANELRDADVLQMLKAKESELREVIAVEYADKERGESLERNKQLIEIKAMVGVLMDRFDAVVAQTQRAKEAAKRASSAFLLGETVAMSRPLGEQLSEASEKSELGKLVAESIPENAVSGGVLPFERLKKDFCYASRRGLSVAMVPEGRAGTIWGHLLGAIFSRLKIPIDSRDDETTLVPRTNEERIRRAERLVDEGDLNGAIVTLEGLNGLSADVMRDWLGAAKARVAAELAGKVLLADAIIAQVALVGEEIGGK